MAWANPRAALAASPHAYPSPPMTPPTATPEQHAGQGSSTPTQGPYSIRNDTDDDDDDDDESDYYFRPPPRAPSPAHRVFAFGAFASLDTHAVVDGGAVSHTVRPAPSTQKDTHDAIHRACGALRSLFGTLCDSPAPPSEFDLARYMDDAVLLARRIKRSLDALHPAPCDFDLMKYPSVLAGPATCRRRKKTKGKATHAMMLRSV
ncbi:hypothetical protein SeLEV6574_g06103 [Synchytrium endobioticum]|nr:hypothetical protein SeLEV6574_g06103 [Synchytrium endobioticum]